MAVTEKLYPPTIASSIPAFYGTTSAKLVVPFSMNRAVSENDVKGFALKIKTAQSNNYIITLEVTNELDVKRALENNEVTFTWNTVQKVVIGQYLKVQLAYMTSETVNNQITYNPGYFSTVATVKYTTKPIVEILNIQYDPTDEEIKIPVFQQTYTGIYKIDSEGDKSERPYSYCFSLYNQAQGLVESSGWKLHNSSINTIASETLQLEETTDTYTFQTSLRRNATYYIDYKVRTINDLEVTSLLYPVIDVSAATTNKGIKLIAENIFEEGYVNLSLNVDISQFYTYVLRDKILQYYNATDIVQNNNNYYVKRNEDTIKTLTGIDDQITQSNSISIIIERAEVGYNENINEDDYDWKAIKTVSFKNYEDVLSWSFKDFTIEQGINYCYAFKQYNKNQVFSNRVISNIIEADFEDMFLWDGIKQLKIRFNPKVSSFKINRQEQKIDTIGNKYPYFFRNGVVEYKEFPINGLISYLADNNEMFVHHEEDLNILLPQYSEREGTPSYLEDYKRTATLDSLGYNIRAERRFKMKVLEWLSDGKIKLFRSPAEGNFLVRLMNVSLSPEDRVGRMIHSFSAQAYEVADLNYDNLLSLELINLTTEEITQLKSETIQIIEKIANDENFYKINTYNIKNRFSIYSVTEPFYAYIGGTEDSNKWLITQVGLTVVNEGNTLQDIYIKGNSYNSVSNVFLYYEYDSIEALDGTIINDLNQEIEEVYVTTEVGQKTGSSNRNNSVLLPQEINSSTHTIKDLIKYYSLEFLKKNEITLYKIDNKYYDQLENGTEVTSFNKISLYKVIENDTTTYYITNSSTTLQSVITPNYNIILNEDNNQTFSVELGGQFMVQPDNVTHIFLGNATYVNYSRQVKITKVKEGA